MWTRKNMWVGCQNSGSKAESPNMTRFAKNNPKRCFSYMQSKMMIKGTDVLWYTDGIISKVIQSKQNPQLSMSESNKRENPKVLSLCTQKPKHQ